ncbi:MAG TPA: 2-C-methyl-D-erythritol 4-phosphate cytidylyltransferase [Vicinamibacterales bacterium]|jgi:2-C-methyl-D-erythritol 4-phosphate cytidylyltransferase/2-C-methyl-D-erythritol 2,4-cyclodiphosphate synthase|nr:2-C-methyl-D-erythritol 4-phosphate cytidylyltransferase [Vicinamibacterales bacterium]
MYVTAIIAAGGRGVRFGAERPKQLLTIGRGTLLERSVEAFLAHRSIDAVVVALPPELLAAPPPYLRSATKPLRLVAGGTRRQDSVYNAFQATDQGSDVILVHDAARPFVSPDLIGRTIGAAVAHGAAIAALEVNDTVKRVNEVNGERVIAETIPRNTIVLAQTPQAFRREVLAAAVALGQTGSEATDEAALAERAGYPVHVVAGESGNVKITTAQDLEEARRRAGPVTTGRAGVGYDLHRLVAGRQLILGGVAVPAERGALGHSDADVICHAVTDAILGAGSLGDIGLHFPDSDPRWKDASSVGMLRHAVRLAADGGFDVENIDVTVVLESPRLRAYIEAIRASLAAAVEIDLGRISVKAKTNEGVDAVGRGEAIAAHAIAMLRPRTSV